MVYDLLLEIKMVSLWVIVKFGSGKPCELHSMVTDSFSTAGSGVNVISVFLGLSVEEKTVCH